MVGITLAPALNKFLAVLSDVTVSDQPGKITIEQQEMCMYSGSALVTGVISENGIVAGDQLSIDFDQCYEGESRIHGGLIVTFTAPIVLKNAFERDAGAHFSVSLEFEALSVYDRNDLLGKMNGIAHLMQSSTNHGDMTIVSGVRLALSTKLDTFVLTDFEMNEFVDRLSGLQTFTIVGTLSASSLDGSLVFDTQDAFIQRHTDNFPSQGVLLVGRDGGPTIVFTVLDNANVQFVVDNDRDGQVDETTVTTWFDVISDFQFFH